jgi:glycosyltransferase involved in cell wall biosynthesis
MTTAVLDIDFEHLPPLITGLERHSHALILVRLRGQPVGQVRLPVADGCIDGAELRAMLVYEVDWIFWERWLHNYLNWEETLTLDFTLPPATVAICTRDRPDQLRRCLEALMRLPDDGQEMLVVDNCPSTDATYRLVQEYKPVRYVHEDRPGLNFARNRALREARHEIIAFVDDDAVLDPGWLRALVRNYDDPLVLCVTGLTMPLELETEAQEWFERYSSFGRGFRRRVIEKVFHNPLSAGGCGVGANMSFRQSVLDLVGPFDEALDTGTPTRSGGDNEMFSRILAGGYRVVYDPAALNWHSHRRTRAELRQILYNYGVGVIAAWTRSLLVDGEWGVPHTAWSWVYGKHLKELGYTLLRRPGSIPLDLILAQLQGCIVGPWAYISSRRHLLRSKQHDEIPI